MIQIVGVDTFLQTLKNTSSEMLERNSIPLIRSELLELDTCTMDVSKQTWTWFTEVDIMTL